jgi:hypothetical protein
MQAVILLLLLVAGSLVHGTPQEAQEGGKSMYKYRKRSTNFIHAVATVGDMVADRQAWNLA